jgi:hypothetical protein
MLQVDYIHDEEWHQWNQEAKRRIMGYKKLPTNNYPSNLSIGGHTETFISSLTGPSSNSNRMVEGLNATRGVISQPTGLDRVNQGQQVNQGPPVSCHDDEVATTRNQTDQEMVASVAEAAAHVSHTSVDFSFTDIHMDENEQVQQAAQVRN